MGELTRYAKEVKQPEKKDGFIGGRIPKSLEKRFKDYIAGLGLSQAEAIQILIEKELDNQAAPVSKSASHSINDSSPVVAPGNSIPEKKPVKAKTGKRFTVNKWKREIDGKDMLPCPICEEWKSAKNFSRHAKDAHNKKSMDIFLEYMAIADDMAADHDKQKEAQGN